MRDKKQTNLEYMNEVRETASICAPTAPVPARGHVRDKTGAVPAQGSTYAYGTKYYSFDVFDAKRREREDQARRAGEIEGHQNIIGSTSVHDY